MLKLGPLVVHPIINNFQTARQLHDSNSSVMTNQLIEHQTLSVMQVIVLCIVGTSRHHTTAKLPLL